MPPPKATIVKVQDVGSPGLMPPPPLPSQPPKILEQEITALTNCLRAAAVKTGQIYQFYSTTHKLGIQNHAPTPRSLTASLGREIEKYDQLCDAINSRISRAIDVLERDLAREEKARAEEEQKAAAAAAALATQPKSPDAELVASPTAMSTTELPPPTPSHSPPARALSGRRQSTISISSLQRPAFPLKLDLSASSLRLSAEEAAFMSSGLHSPVTLAPKSARPVEYPMDIMAALASASSSTDPSTHPVDIDLTLSEPAFTDLGNSADKPIPLDLDMDIDMGGLFGDGDSNAGLFSPVEENGKTMKTTKESDDFLSSLGVTEPSGDIFGPSLQPPGDADRSAATAPSPGTILSQFTAEDGGASSLPLEVLDFPTFLDSQIDLSMDALLSMDSNRKE